MQAGIYGDLDDVDFAERAVVVYSSAQSGSCSGWPDVVSFVDGTLDVVDTDAVPDGARGPMSS